ncbi:NAD(P)/FAD-dependent oxidoreductase [Nesterenkonia ebinurensis]|uniref:NAD(P)/FAD-dependent oxidoreductase n=1 Tax=Nesterenkonia ebinurensis TaxID=2608252 RepID=UPI00123D7BC6|nr:FAD-binding oxidoreductase [Nesterenkonia ebinurensis]
MSPFIEENDLRVIQNSHWRPHVVVVGAGVVGANITLELAAQGAEVTVLAANASLEEGATPNSFAWITNQTFFRAKDPVPDDKARAYFNLHRLSHAAWRRLQLKLNDRLGVRWNGAVQWAYQGQQEEIVRIRAELERRQSWGSPSYPVSALEIGELLPSAQLPEEPAIALFANDEGIVDPFSAVPALLKAAQRLGVTVEAPRVVETFESAAGDRILVKHSEGSTVCDKVVIAAGRQTPDLAAEVDVQVPLAESSGDLVHFAPQEDLIAPMVMAPDLHALQRPDGRVIVARHYTGVSSGDIDDDGELDPSEVIKDAAEIFPALKGAKVEKTTRGRRVVPVDGLPIVGESKTLPGVHVMATNAGISLGPAFGQLLTTEVLYGAEVDLFRDYRPERFAS